jgi:hypothetical protein
LLPLPSAHCCTNNGGNGHCQSNSNYRASTNGSLCFSLSKLFHKEIFYRVSVYIFLLTRFLQPDGLPTLQIQLLLRWAKGNP